MGVKKGFRRICSLIMQDERWVGEEGTGEAVRINHVGRTCWLQELMWGVQMKRGMVALWSPVVRDEVKRIQMENPPPRLGAEADITGCNGWVGLA